jgi:hypothetical protein
VGGKQIGWRQHRTHQAVSGRSGFDQMFELMQNDRDFATWYTDQLRESRFPAYFWEHPPLNKSNLDSNAEFVLVNAPVLVRLRPDAEAFRSYFEGDNVVTFRNLGGDAILS